jgi:hypothetical protein
MILMLIKVVSILNLKHSDHGFMRVFKGEKWRLEKGKIIQEFLRISKIPLSGIQIEVIRKNRQNKIFFLA